MAIRQLRMIERKNLGANSSHYVYVYGKQGGSFVAEWNHLYDAGSEVLPVAGPREWLPEG